MAGAASVLVLLTTTLAGCRADTVAVSFRPRAGARFSYRIDVVTTTTTRLGPHAPTVNVDRERLTADETVVGVTGTGADIRVALHSDRVVEVLLVHYDRADHLTGVRREDNLSLGSLGQLGLAEVFPASLDAPPVHGLRPGDTWLIDAPLVLAPSASTVTHGRVSGHGRLVELSTRRGHSVAIIRTVLDVPVDGTYAAASGAGAVGLHGVETTESTASRNIKDGVVEDESSDSRASFDVTAMPPSGITGPPVSGSLSVVVHATTALTTPAA